MWVITSLCAAITWGVLYVSAGQVMKTTDKFAYLALVSLINVTTYFSIASWSQKLYTLKPIISDPKWFLIVAISSLLGNFLTFSAVQQKSATHAAAIEISYPIWCAIITMVFIGYSPINARQYIGLFIAVIGTFIFIMCEK